MVKASDPRQPNDLGRGRRLGVEGSPLPMHLSEGGLPIGIQLVGRYGREDVLVRLASQLEAAFP